MNEQEYMEMLKRGRLAPLYTSRDCYRDATRTPAKGVYPGLATHLVDCAALDACAVAFPYCRRDAHDGPAWPGTVLAGEPVPAGHVGVLRHSSGPRDPRRLNQWAIVPARRLTAE